MSNAKQRRRATRASKPGHATGLLALATPAVNVPEGLILSAESEPLYQDRWIQATRFAGAGVERVAGVLNQAENGWQWESQDLYEWMIETDPHVGSVYGTRLLGLSSLPWDIEPSDADGDNAARVADFVRKTLRAIPNFQVAINELADGIGKGYAVQEIIWGRAPGAWVPLRLDWRHQRRFCFGPAWDLRLDDMGRHGAYGEELPAGKYIVHQPKQRSGYPTRTGALRSIAFHWVFRRWVMKFWLNGTERFGMPLPYGHVADGTEQNVINAFKTGLQNLTSGQVAIFKGETKVDFLPSQSVQTTIYQDINTMLCAEITKAILGSTLNVDQGPNGNRAAAESQAAITIDPRIKYDSTALAETITHQLIRPLLEFNSHLFGGVVPSLPHFKFLLEQDADVKIEPYHLQGKLVRRNEVRRNLNLDPAPGTFGEEFLDIGGQPTYGQPAQPAFTDAPASASGGTPPESPLEHTGPIPPRASRTLPADSSPASTTSLMSSPFVTTPLGRALSKL